MNWYAKLANEQITGVAMTLNDGNVISLPKPNRHHNLFPLAKEKGYKKPYVGVQGFVTSTGRFVDRSEGAELALRNGQITKLKTPPDLFSEDMW